MMWLNIGLSRKITKIRLTPLFYEIGLCSATSIESSRRDLLTDVAEHGPIFQNNPNTFNPRFGFTPKTGMPKRGFVFTVYDVLPPAPGPVSQRVRQRHMTRGGGCSREPVGRPWAAIADRWSRSLISGAGAAAAHRGRHRGGVGAAAAQPGLADVAQTAQAARWRNAACRVLASPSRNNSWSARRHCAAVDGGKPFTMGASRTRCKICGGGRLVNGDATMNENCRSGGFIHRGKVHAGRGGRPRHLSATLNISTF